MFEKILKNLRIKAPIVHNIINCIIANSVKHNTLKKNIMQLSGSIVDIISNIFAQTNVVKVKNRFLQPSLHMVKEL